MKGFKATEENRKEMLITIILMLAALNEKGKGTLVQVFKKEDKKDIEFLIKHNYIENREGRLYIKLNTHS